MKGSIFSGAAAMSAVLLLSSVAHSQAVNDSPPLGAILDLDGQLIPHAAPQLYSVDFTASQAATAITFAFREDPAFIQFSGVSVTDITSPGTNLLINGDFSGGVYTDNGNSGTPNGWTYANVYGASFGGGVQSGCGAAGSNCWNDGAVQAYDALSQTVSTSLGDTYAISFFAQDSGSLTNWSRVSTNGDTSDEGGNGADILTYAQAGLPPPAMSAAPEPSTWLLMFAGIGGIGLMLRQAKKTMGFQFKDAFSA